MDALQDIVFWHWWMIAAVLMVLELFWPIFLFLWLGFAAAGLGFLLLVFPSTPPEAQLAVFAFLALVTGVAWHRYRRAHPARDE